MKFLIILLLSSACTTSAQQVPGTVQFLAEDAKVRREGVSYTTSVIHQNPKYPDQHAESTIKVDLHNHRTKQGREVQTKPNAAYQNIYLQKRPKALPIYTHQYQQTFPHQPPSQYAVEEKIPQPNQVFTSIQSPPYNSPQSQSFNVGYSVSFTGNQKPQIARALPRQRLESAEIITGSRKDVVRKPTPQYEEDDFVTNPLIDIKKQKVSGIKPKPHKFSGSKDNDAKSFINNLAPKTQQYLSYLGDTKPVASSNTRFRQQLQSSDAQAVQGLRTSWTNLSPSVEIYHSRDVPQQHNFTPRQQQEQSKKFNHAAALGTSLGFDYTNALDSQNEQKQLGLPQTYQENSAENIENKLANLGQNYNDLLGNVAGNALISYTNPATPLNAVPVSSFNPLQLPQKFEESQGIPKQLPLLHIQSSGVPPKLPINWSLMRQPILVTNAKKAVLNDPHTLTIPFDTTLLDTAKQKLAASSPLIEAFNDASKGQVQVLDENAGIAEQQFQGQLENLQVQPLEGLKQDSFPDQGFQQLQGQQLQQTQQFNVYGLPQQAMFLNKGFDQYFDQYFEKMQPQETRFESTSVRFPKISNSNNININNNNRAWSNKGVAIHTDLQPPPIKITRHRRMYKG